jgi:uncharacterized membrane protein
MTVGPGFGAGGSGGGSPGYPVSRSGGVSPKYPAAGGVTPGYVLAGSARAQMRVSTQDRDQAVELLARAFAEGRLTPDEHNARVGRAMAAATFADLDAVVTDLPGSVPPPPPATNQLAIASLVCGVGQVAFATLATIPAIICGHMARRQIRRTGEQGAGMALAGLILGWAGLAIQVLALVAVILAAVFIAPAVNVPPPPPPG